MVDVRCPHCGAQQRADENKYEVPCKKCKELFVVEEGIELYLSDEEITAAKGADLTPEEALSRGLAFLEQGDFAFAKDYLERACDAMPENAVALWGLCRAVMCVREIDPTEEEIAFAMGEEEKAIALYAERNAVSEARADYELRRSLRKLSCYTDEESDALFEAAVEYAEPQLRQEITQKYAVYAFRSSDAAEDSALPNGEGLLGRVYDVRPNFAPQRPLIDVKVLIALIVSLAVVAGTSVLIAIDRYNGWIIALLVVGIVAMLICALILWLDKRKSVVYRLIYENYFTDIADLARAMYRVKDEEALNATLPSLLTLLYNMIASAQLTHIGISEGRYLQYYDEDYNLIDPNEQFAAAQGEKEAQESATEQEEQ